LDEAKELLEDIGIQTHNPDGTERTKDELLQDMLRVTSKLEEAINSKALT